MRLLIINPPHPSIGSRIPREQLPPLGLLSIGGPLIDDGHDVALIDAEFGPMPFGDIVRAAMAAEPDVILLGHSGSTSAHPIVADLTRMLHIAIPAARVVYGGVFPTYHWRDILNAEPQIDIIVRGEGEATARNLVHALETGRSLAEVPGIAYRANGVPTATSPATVIRDLDAYRVGWELIDHKRYSYWGGKRAVVVQFSRGCPHLCNYCGQRGFWTRWRHRDPQKFAAEIARLHREHGVEVINFADENPTVSRKAWLAFLEALIAEDVNLTLVGSTRADDIVRDADILHLYKKAGFERFLLGMENTDEAALDLIRKGGATKTDRQAISLLRAHGILSMATWVVGFEDERPRDLLRGLRQLLSYDPDQIQALYCDAASLDAVLSSCGEPAGRTNGPAPMGLQAPGPCHAPLAALVPAALCEMHRSHRSVAPKGALARAGTSRRKAPPRDAMVHPHGPARMATRDIELPVSRTTREAWPVIGGILRIRAGCGGGIHESTHQGACRVIATGRGGTGVKGQNDRAVRRSLFILRSL